MLGAAFAVYVFYAQPGAAEDPLGAAGAAVVDLYTSCYRPDSACARAGVLLAGAVAAGKIGFNLVWGNGRLVYVPYTTTPEPASDITTLINRLARPSSGPCATG